MKEKSIRELFDHIYVLSAPKNERTRLPLILAELERIGAITGPSDEKLSVHYGSHPRLFDFALDHTERIGPSLAPGCYGKDLIVTFNYYLILSEAKERGFKKILYVEDDERFLRDVKDLTHRINTLPEDADFAMLDWIVCDLHYFRSGAHKAHIEAHSGNDWIEMHPYGNFICAGSQILTDKSICVLIKLMESGWYEIPGKNWCNQFKISDQWQDQGVLGQFGIKSYFAYPLIGMNSLQLERSSDNLLWLYERSFENGIEIKKYSDNELIEEFLHTKNGHLRRVSESK